MTRDLRAEVSGLQQKAAQLVMEVVLDVLENNRPLNHRGLSNIGNLHGDNVLCERLRSLRKRIHGKEEYVVADRDLDA